MGNITCDMDYKKYRKSDIRLDTIYAFYYFFKDKTKRKKT